MEFLLIHYKAVIAVIGSFTGLLGICLTLYSTQQDSKLKLLELELKKDQFKEDKKHQITKEKYQELFAKKIKIYTILYKELYKFHTEVIHISKVEYQLVGDNREYKKIETTKQDVILRLWQSIHKIFNDNLLFISNELEEQYQKILLQYTNALVSLGESEYYMCITDKEDYDKAHQDAMLTFFTKCEEDINSLVLEIKKEIKEIKSDLMF